MAIIGIGSFSQPSGAGAVAANVTIQVPSNLDCLEVWNATQAENGGSTTNAVYSYWQRPSVNSAGVTIGMDSTGTKGIFYSANNGIMDVGLSAANAFVLYDPSINLLGPLNNGSTQITAITGAANPPVATVGSTAGMAAGSVVRIYYVAGALQLQGLDFTVGYGAFSGTTFSLDYMPAIAVATTGNFRVIKADSIFYPSHRYITKITQAAQAVISFSVTHGYKIGQAIRLNVPAAFGMVEINGLVGTIVAINTATTAVTGNTVTVNIDSSAFTAFAFPTSATAPFSPAMATPVGENTGQALASGQNILSDATTNTAYLGMTLAAGALLPAGSVNLVDDVNVGDTVVWRATKADFGGL